MIEWTIAVEKRVVKVKTSHSAKESIALDKAAFKLYGRLANEALRFNKLTVIKKRII